MSMSSEEVWSPYPVGRVGAIRHCDLHEDCEAADETARTIGNALVAYHWRESSTYPPFPTCEAADRVARESGLIAAIHCHDDDCADCHDS